MSEDAKRFLEESKGLASEPPWGMTTTEAAAFDMGSAGASQTITHLRRALGSAIQGAIKSEQALRRERDRSAMLQQLLDDERDRSAMLRRRVDDLEEEVASYDDPALD